MEVRGKGSIGKLAIFWTVKADSEYWKQADPL